MNGLVLCFCVDLMLVGGEFDSVLTSSKAFKVSNMTKESRVPKKTRVMVEKSLME
jgi:hypothetical protein